MNIRPIAAAAAALSLAATPAIANVDRASAPVEGESEIGSGAIFGALAVAAIIAGVVIAATNDDADDGAPISA